MVAIKSKKKSLQLRLSDETYNKVIALTNGDNPPFESVSEYLYTVIISDLARRELGEVSIKEAVSQLLDDEDIQKRIREIISN